MPVTAPPPTDGTLRMKMSESRSGAHDFVNYAEIRRIIGMPLVFPMDGPECEAYCRENIIASAYEDGFRLWPVQAEAVAAFELYNGLFGPIGVGWGKTLVSLMIARRYHTGRCAEADFVCLAEA